MGREKKDEKEQPREEESFPGTGDGIGDWGGSDGFSLWENAAGSSGEWLKDWKGRRETHDMLHESYD